MTPDAFRHLLQDIVARATQLKNEHGVDANARVNYACIFTQSDDEREAMLTAASHMGHVIRETPSGPIFLLTKPMHTDAGNLRLVKIRRPDPARPERGDADFTVANYAALKARVADEPAFTLVTRPECEMLELVSTALNIRAYFSDKPIDEELGIV